MSEVVTDNENRDLFSDMETTSAANHHHYSNNQLVHSAHMVSLFKQTGNDSAGQAKDNNNPFAYTSLNLHH